MKTYFDDLQSIEKSEFLTKFDEHIKERPKIDSTEKQIFQTLQDSASLSYYLGTLSETGIDHLILPHHAVELEAGRDPDRPVKVGGDKFRDVIRNYIESYIPNSRFPECIAKVQGQQSRFFNNYDSPLKADFLFVCNQKEYAHPRNSYDDSHGKKKIYIGNGFHRFVAYGLWISQNGFKPLKLHYVEQSI